MTGIRTVHLAAPDMVDPKLNTIKSFRLTVEMSQQFGSKSHRVDCSDLQIFLDFWTRLNQLKCELDNGVYLEIVQYCGSITRLRHPELLEQIQGLHVNLCKMCLEEYDFNQLQSSEHDTFTFSVMLGDKHNHCLIAYIPTLLQLCSKICFLVSKIFLEKV